MTVSQYEGDNGAVALPDNFDDGLGDFEPTDAAVPRLTIQHKDGRFKESLSGQTYESLSVIILGLVKQRTLWAPVQEDDMKPMCKSTNFLTGYPNVAEDTPKDHRFPWEKSGFDPASAPKNELDQVILPCQSCPLKEWGSHPNGKVPWCSEEFTLPLLYDATGEGDWMPAVLTIKKTGLKNIKQYLASFQRQRKPAFSVITKVTLTQQSRGQTEYCVPNWAAEEKTSIDDWPGFSQSFVGLKEFLQMPPAVYDEDGERIQAAPPEQSAGTALSSPQSAAQEAAEPEPEAEPEQPTAKVSQPAASSAPADDDDDDMPF